MSLKELIQSNLSHLTKVKHTQLSHNQTSIPTTVNCKVHSPTKIGSPLCVWCIASIIFVCHCIYSPANPFYIQSWCKPIR